MNESPEHAIVAKSVSRETVQRLDHFAALFQKWSRSINLVAPSTLNELWTRHIQDSLQIYLLSPGPLRWVDLGSGGGFPGVITGICLAEVAGGWVHLVESNNKKAAFLRAAIQQTGARASVHNIRIETASQQISGIDRVSARALADLDGLFDYILPWAENNPSLVAYLHKGRDYRREVAVSNGRWIFDLVEHQSQVDEDSTVLEISHLARKQK